MAGAEDLNAQAQLLELMFDVFMGLLLRLVELVVFGVAIGHTQTGLDGAEEGLVQAETLFDAFVLKQFLRRAVLLLGAFARLLGRAGELHED